MKIVLQRTMRAPYFALLCLCAFSLFRCGGDEAIDPAAPVACFATGDNTLYAKVGVAFNADCSKNASTYTWDFGDGEVSTSASPSHIYKEQGSYTVTLKVENALGQIHSASKKINVQASPFTEHTGYIDQAEVWKEGMHLITGNVYIRHGSLTIEPGAVIHVNKEKSISVGHKDTATPGGALFTANGTAAKPIVFQPSSGQSLAGEWGHIFFTDKASANSSMDYCDIKFGGKANATWDYEAFTYYTNYGIVHVGKTAVKINNTKISGAANYAVSLSENGYFTAFTGNTLSNNVNHPIYIHVNYAHTIGAGNTIQSTKGIYVYGQDFMQPSATWRKQNVPYVLVGEKRLLTGQNGPSNLTIEPGTTIALKKSASIQVGLYSEGHLYAEGTASEPIIFTSAEDTKTKGDWFGIYAWDKSTFKYCRFEYGGGKDFQNYSRILVVSDAESVVSNCTFTEAPGDALDLGDFSLATLQNNTFEKCDGYAIRLSARQFHTMSFNQTITGTKGVIIEPRELALEGAVTWAKCPYKLTFHGTLRIQSQTGVSSLTIAPGSTIRFTEASSIVVGSDSWLPGTLIADGTSERITLTIDEAAKAQGKYWGNIRFGAGTSAATKLVNCEISYGGYAPVDPWFGMIDCTSTTGKPTISNCTISNSYGYGISLKNATPALTNNTFSANTKSNTYTY